MDGGGAPRALAQQATPRLLTHTRALTHTHTHTRARARARFVVFEQLKEEAAGDADGIAALLFAHVPAQLEALAKLRLLTK